MVRKTIRTYLILSLASRFSYSFSVATYVMFLLSRGLSIFETSLVNMVFFATLLVFEIPTGALADVFGRKFSFVASCYLSALGFFFYYLSGSFWGFALAEAMIAVGHTFASGAFQAWLVDKLEYHGFEGELKKIFSYEQSLGNLATILGSVLGAYLAKVNLTWPWLACTVGMLLVGIAAQLVMREEYFVKQKMSWVLGWQAFKQVLSASWQACLKNKQFRFLVLLGTVQYFSVQALNMQWQPYFSRSFNISSEYLGWIFSSVSVFLLLGALAAPYFSHKVKSEKKILLLVQGFVGLCIVVASFSKIFPLALIFFLLHEFGRGMFKPLKDQYLNDNIESSKLRATLISFESMSHHGGGLLGLFFAGLLAQVFSIQIAWLVSGVLLLTMSALLVKNGKT